MLSAPPPQPRRLRAARLPAWLGAPWTPGHERLHDLHLHGGRVVAIHPYDPDQPAAEGDWLLHGAPVLPGLVEAHAHLDKAYTVHRAPPCGPGLLAQIEATERDSACWTPADLRQRAERALREALAAGVRCLRTHVNWSTPAVPKAWRVYQALREEWRDRVTLEMVNLTPLPVYADATVADRIAHEVARSDGGVLGGFVHSTNHDDAALRVLLEAAARHDLRVDLHVDEELVPAARGVASAAAIAATLPLAGRVVCSHACALAVQDADTADRTLDAMAAAGFTLVSLPATNLLLQDAQTGRTPRQRGISLVHEARARGIPVLLGSDNVQDAFNPVGRHDPVATFELGLVAVHLPQAYDAATALICDAAALGAAPPLRTLLGADADLVVFDGAHPSAAAWPADVARRHVLRAGRPLSPVA